MGTLESILWLWGNDWTGGSWEISLSLEEQVIQGLRKRLTREIIWR